MGMIRAYDAAGKKRTILVSTTEIVTLFTRFRQPKNRDGDARRSGYAVEATISTSYDGPTLLLALCPTSEEADALRDELGEALTTDELVEGLFQLDEGEGLIEVELAYGVPEAD